MVKKQVNQLEKYKLCKYCHHGYIVQELDGLESTGCSLIRNRSKCKKLKYLIYSEKGA